MPKTFKCMVELPRIDRRYGYHDSISQGLSPIRGLVLGQHVNRFQIFAALHDVLVAITLIACQMESGWVSFRGQERTPL